MLFVIICRFWTFLHRQASWVNVIAACFLVSFIFSLFSKKLAAWLPYSVASSLLQFDGETYAFGWLVLQVMQGHLFCCGEKEDRRWMAS
ncbi:hypothetical protein RchiOBHm_Chr6g0261491 [Rosa chinensis]|uniref:Uncharacterized protein n=1 Tax=Rosa chinensis TaxID=74649 RepID=A0A2P6PNG7_ROSCH|nr:hypothetical protein RchiOBHm_Chr6g0261491 [Rosa chinensis]